MWARSLILIFSGPTSIPEVPYPRDPMASPSGGPRRRASAATLSGSSCPTSRARRSLDSSPLAALSDLVDPQEALTVGRILAADYLLTGTVIPMSESVVVFARILNVESAVIESVAQVIVARSPEVDSLL